MPTPTKTFHVLRTIIATAAAAGATVLAIQAYRRPLETATNLIRAGMLLSGVREATCDVGGVPIHYYCAGRRGTPLILVHGLGGSAEDLAPLMLLLNKQYLVYAFDLPGFGRTPLAPEKPGIHTYVLYLERFLDALGYPRVTLVGSSLGGWIATRFAAEHPGRVERLYLLNSAGLRREGWKSPQAVDRAAAKEALTRVWGSPLPLPSFVLDAAVRSSQRPAYTGFIENYDPQEELDGVLGQVQAPTTIIWGMLDGLFPVACAHDFHAGIANSELILLPRIGHVPHAQAPLTVARIILSHLPQHEVSERADVPFGRHVDTT